MKRSVTHYSDWPLSEWRWPHFSPREIASKGEGALLVDFDAMDKLQALRSRLGKPLILTSAYRSPAHNRAVGGAKNSYHMQARAFDVRMENQNPAEFEAAARAVGFTGFGHYVSSGFMHIDTRDEPIVFRGEVEDWPETETRLPPEQKRQRPDKLSQNREAQVGGGIAAASTGVGLASQVTREGGIIDRLQDPSTLAFVVAAAAVWLVWRAVTK